MINLFRRVAATITGKFAIVQLLVIIALLSSNAWNRHKIHQLKRWQDGVISALSVAADVRDKSGAPALLDRAQAIRQITIFGQFRNDVIRANIEAKLREAATIARVRRAVESSNKETLDDYQSKLAAARAVADHLRACLMRNRASATADPGCPGQSKLPALPAATSRTDAPADPHRLPQPDRPDFTLDARLLATEQALQLDALIKSVAALAAIDPNAAVEREANEQ